MKSPALQVTHPVCQKTCDANLALQKNLLRMWLCGWEKIFSQCIHYKSPDLNIEFRFLEHVKKNTHNLPVTLPFPNHIHNRGIYRVHLLTVVFETCTSGSKCLARYIYKTLVIYRSIFTSSNQPKLQASKKQNGLRHHLSCTSGSQCCDVDLGTCASSARTEDPGCGCESWESWDDGEVGTEGEEYFGASLSKLTGNLTESGGTK